MKFPLPTGLSKSRWYGTAEHGYLLWSSVTLHERFGFKYYEPIQYEEGGGGEKRAKSTPAWLGDFYSLPNICLPMS